MSIDMRLLGTPINGTTQSAVSGGQHYTPPEAPANLERWEAPPLTVSVNHRMGEPDLTGCRKGRLTVIGRLPRKQGQSNKRGPRWLVRCDCGWYESIQARRFKDPESFRDRCFECNHLRRLKRGH